MLKLAVLGKDVSKSDSPAIHNFILKHFGVDCSYEKVSIPPAEFSALAERMIAEYDAFNVTIPFKGEIIPFLSSLEGDARSFGAVNTVVCATRKGYNTDGYGFLLMLKNEGIELKGKSVLVLGAGGAGRSCIKKLCESGAEVYAFERDGERLKAVYEEFGGFTPLYQVPSKAFDIIINCTGVGMHNTVGQVPSVLYETGEIAPADALISQCNIAVDLIYVPAESEFLRLARINGKRTVNGAAMLFYQAYMADCIFLGREPDAEEARKLWIKFQEDLK